MHSFQKLLDQPTVKRARLKEGMPSMWDARYVSVGSKLPVDGYLFVSFRTLFQYA